MNQKLVRINSIDGIEQLNIVKNYLINNISECNIQIIKEADHLYTNKYDELGVIINNSL